MMSEDENNQNNAGFPIVVGDGVFIHFLEGFASLLFYQNRVLPPEDNKDGLSKADLRREIMFDIRLPIRAVNELYLNLEQCLGIYNTRTIMDKPFSIWSDSTRADEYITEDMATVTGGISPEKAALAFMSNILKNITKEGKDKIQQELFPKFIHDNIDELNRIGKEYAKEKKVETE